MSASETEPLLKAEEAAAAATKSPTATFGASKSTRSSASDQVRYSKSRQGTGINLSANRGRSSSEPKGFKLRIVVFWSAVAICEVITVLTIAPLVTVWCTTLLKGDVNSKNETVRMDTTWHGKFATFNYHPLFMTWALVVFLTQALLVFRVLSRLGYASKDLLKRLHVILHSVSLVLIAIGLAATFDYHAHMNKSHMTTTHSWLGLTTVLAFVLQFVAGCILYLREEGRCVSAPMQKASVHWHRMSGVSIIILAAATIMTGITEAVEYHNPSSRGYPDSAVARVGQAIAILLPFAIVALGVTLSKAEYRRRAEKGERKPLNTAGSP